MPMVDSDQIVVQRVSRSANRDLSVMMQWKQADGTVLGTFNPSWASFDELKAFVEQQDFDDLLRAFMLQVINRTTGGFRQAVFDGLAGKTFEINVRVKDITA